MELPLWTRPATSHVMEFSPFTWNFVIVDVNYAILGADFLEYHKILVDIYRSKLIDKVTKLLTLATVAKTNQQSLHTVADGIDPV